MAVVSEAAAKKWISSTPYEYITAFGTLIPKGYPTELWTTFNDEQKFDYVQWYFNKDDDKLGDPTTLNKNSLLDLLEQHGVKKDIFLARFPDKQFNPDKPHDNTAITALNVYNKAIEPKRKGGSRRRCQRTRKYKKSKRVFRTKNRQTRRR